MRIERSDCNASISIHYNFPTGFRVLFFDDVHGRTARACCKQGLYDQKHWVNFSSKQFTAATSTQLGIDSWTCLV